MASAALTYKVLLASALVPFQSAPDILKEATGKEGRLQPAFLTGQGVASYSRGQTCHRVKIKFRPLCGRANLTMSCQKSWLGHRLSLSADFCKSIRAGLVFGEVVCASLGLSSFDLGFP